MSKIIKETLILLIITLVAGVSLGFVYDITKNPIKEQEEKNKREAFKNVFETADSFSEPLEFDEDAVVAFIAKKDEENKKADATYENKEINASIDEAVKAYDKDGNEIGYVITVTDKEAYGGSVTFTVGITNDGTIESSTVNGISFLSLSETPGLGMRANDDSFKSQFENKNVKYIKYSKNGSEDPEAIDAISGATITSNAVTNGTTAAIYFVEYEITTGGGANE